MQNEADCYMYIVVTKYKFLKSYNFFFNYVKLYIENHSFCFCFAYAKKLLLQSASILIYLYTFCVSYWLDKKKSFNSIYFALFDWLA